MQGSKRRPQTCQRSKSAVNAQEDVLEEQEDEHFVAVPGLNWKSKICIVLNTQLKAFIMGCKREAKPLPPSAFQRTG